MIGDRLVPATGRGVLALVAVALFFGGAVGFAIAERGDAVPGPDSVDVGFLRDMIAHHEQALVLSIEEMDNGETPGVQVVAEEILQQQAYEIGLMERQLDAWGYARRDPAGGNAMEWMGMSMPSHEMPGMASATELDALEAATGTAADALFLALMADHHRGGVEMAGVAAAQASDPWVREIAARMARVQAAEIVEMDVARERNSLTATPAGHTPGPFHGSGDGADHGGSSEEMPGMDHGSDEADHAEESEGEHEGHDGG